MATIDALAPTYPEPRWWLRFWSWLLGEARYRDWPEPCVYCGHRATTRRLVVTPRTLRRETVRLCGRAGCRDRLAAWQGRAETRRQRSVLDWESEWGVAAPHDLVKGMPTQYPSVSRATLRAFLASDEIAATVSGDGLTAATLNASIRALGFGDSVYAEVRSGQAVLRRHPVDEASA